MNKHVRHIQPLPNAEEGWQQMKFLLDAALPVQKQIVKKSPFRFYVSVAFIVAAFLFTSLHLNTGFIANAYLHAHKNVAVDGMHTIATNGLQHRRPSFVLSKTKSRSELNFLFDEGSHLKASDNFNDILNQHLSKGILRNTEGVIEKETIKKMIPNNFLSTQNISFPFVSATEKKKTNLHKWNLLAGLGINAHNSASQNLQPYPVAEIQYRINPSMYIAAGISAWSPTSTIVSGISKTVQVNDSGGNVSVFNERTAYTKLKYADIPLSVGINISKRLAIQTGLQVSVLIHKQKSKFLEPYNYQLTSVVPPASLPVGTAAAPEKQYNVQVNKVDYRVVTGLRYTTNKTTIGLNYQHGLRPAGVQGNADKNAQRNHSISLSVLFKLK